MDVDAEDVAGGAADRLGLAHAGLSGRGQVAAHGREEEGARAAGGIEHPLLERLIDRLGDHDRGQPVGGVVLTEAVALLGADDALIEHLHDVVLDVLPGEAGEPLGK